MKNLVNLTPAQVSKHAEIAAKCAKVERKIRQTAEAQARVDRKDQEFVTVSRNFNRFRDVEVTKMLPDGISYVVRITGLRPAWITKDNIGYKI